MGENLQIGVPRVKGQIFCQQSWITPTNSFMPISMKVGKTSILLNINFNTAGGGYEMTVLTHQMYEIKKGVRNLALLTMSDGKAQKAVERLESRDIRYFVQHFAPGRANVFFGRFECVEVARRLAKRKLNQLTSEEDFILGVLLGYDSSEQCRRYLKRLEGDGDRDRDQDYLPAGEFPVEVNNLLETYAEECG
jgi:hypothetical protein